MNLLTAYSHFCGVKPALPFIDEEYFPILHSDYVVLQVGAGMPSKMYSYWELVVEHIKLPVIQVGGKDDQKIPGCTDLLGKTSWNQTAYLLRRAKLFLGCDSVGNHMSSAFGVPRVTLFGATSPLTCGGYWNRDKGIELTPTDMQGCQAPCHFNQCARSKRCIDSISPNLVLEQAQKYVIAEPANIFYIGDAWNAALFEWVPITINPETMASVAKISGGISIRLDKAKQDIEQISLLMGQINLKVVIISPPDDFKQFKMPIDKVEKIFILIDKNNIEEGIKQMKSLIQRGYRAILMSETGHEDFVKHKVQLMNYAPIAKLNKFNYSKEHAEFIGKSVVARSKRKVLGKDGKSHLTIHDALKDQNSIDLTQIVGSLTIEEPHLQELNFLTLYGKKN